MIFQSIDGTDFGFVGAEDDGYISVSFRSRTGVDVSRLASDTWWWWTCLGFSCRIDILDANYEKAVEKILEKAKSLRRA